MSPRHRSRGRHGGGNGAGAPGNAAAVIAPDEPAIPAESVAAAVASPEARVEVQLDEPGSSPSNGAAHLNGYRPNGAAGAGSYGPPRGPSRGPSRGRPPIRVSGPRPGPISSPVSAPALGADGAAAATDEYAGPLPARRPNCTLAQMRRFIKSRPYVPVHELRRRFEIEGIEDEVSPVTTERGTIYVGLPPEQARFLGDLIRSGDVGCEMLLDPESPGVIGVFPMRPIARQ